MWIREIPVEEGRTFCEDFKFISCPPTFESDIVQD